MSIQPANTAGSRTYLASSVIQVVSALNGGVACVGPAESEEWCSSPKSLESAIQPATPMVRARRGSGRFSVATGMGSKGSPSSCNIHLHTFYIFLPAVCTVVFCSIKIERERSELQASSCSSQQPEVSSGIDTANKEHTAFQEHAHLVLVAAKSDAEAERAAQTQHCLAHIQYATADDSQVGCRHITASFLAIIRYGILRYERGSAVPELLRSPFPIVTGHLVAYMGAHALLTRAPTGQCKAKRTV